jgi:hypothetical protein
MPAAATYGPPPNRPETDVEPHLRFARLAELDLAESEDAFELIAANRERFLVPVRQPLLLVPQIQRSGSTLVSQLLDGHSGIHLHPSELHIGKPKHAWPRIDLAAPAPAIFASLREKNADRHARTGYLKISGAEIASNPNHRDFILPFIFLEALQERLFIGLMRRQPPRSQRAVLDHYATSYFNAWLDYAGLYRDPDSVKYWAAFAARVLIDFDNVVRFFQDYPDGRMLVPLRDPVSWYASARAHDGNYGDLDEALDLWLRCNENAIRAAQGHPEQIVFFRFEDVVARTRPTMAAVLQQLRLAFEPATLEPTFNGMPVISDSSFGAKYGIDRTAVARGDELPPAQRKHIRRRTGDMVALLRARAEHASVPVR